MLIKAMIELDLTSQKLARIIPRDFQRFSNPFDTKRNWDKTWLCQLRLSSPVMLTRYRCANKSFIAFRKKQKQSSRDKSKVMCAFDSSAYLIMN